MQVDVLKQDVVGRGIRHGSRKKGKNLVGVKWKGLIRGLVFRGGWGKISCPVHITNHDISDTFNRAPEAYMAVLWSRKTCRIRAGVQRLVDKKTD
jgi:hypothetical protein